MAGTRTETDLPDVPTFEQAVAAALKQHSTADDDATGAGDDADEHAGGDDDTQGEGDGKPAEKSGRAAPSAGKSGETADEGEETGDEDGEGKETGELLTDAEYKALETKHAKDPAALFKALNTAFTTKSQAMAKDRERFTKLEEFAPVVDAYETNPKGVLELLAEQNGFTLVAKTGDAKVGADGKPVVATAAETPEAAMTAMLDEFSKDVVEGLGPELDYLGEPLTKALGPALQKLIAKATKTTVDGEVKPLREAAERQTARDVELRTDVVMADFEKAHPDWKDHEDVMMKLGEKILPAKGATELEHLENLYKLATGETTVSKLKKDMEAQVAEGVKKALAKMSKGAGEGRRDRDVVDRQVATKHTGIPTFEEAAEAALRGERFT